MTPAANKGPPTLQDLGGETERQRGKYVCVGMWEREWRERQRGETRRRERKKQEKQSDRTRRERETTRGGRETEGKGEITMG